MSADQVSRRDFLRAAAATGAGLTLALQLDGCATPEKAPTANAAFAPDAWIRVGTDNSVLVVIDRSEMGQGISTGLAMLVAEELDCDWSKVKFEFAPANEAYYNPLFGSQATGGSTGLRAGWKNLREGGAKARTMLVQAAAKRWGVPEAECATSAGVVTHAKSGKQATYGELALDAATLPVPATVTLKPASAFLTIGTSPKRLDIPLKVNGTAQFGIDVKLPGMLVATVLRSPVFGGTLDTLDDSKAKAIPGVRQVVKLSTGVAVVGDTYWHAMQGRKALQVTWKDGPHAGLDSAKIREEFVRLAADGEGASARKTGDADKALAGAAARVEAEYDAPYLAHMTMEPMNCTAHVTKDHCELWVPTQFQVGPRLMGGGARGIAVRLTGLAPEQVTVHTTFLGGGFGRRFEGDFVEEAVELAQKLSTPVKVVWSREDDLQHDFYRPATYNKLIASLEASGEPAAWSHVIAGPSIMSRFIPSYVPDVVARLGGPLKGGVDASSVELAANHPYAVSNVSVRYHLADVGVPVGFWRSVGSSQNGWIVESFVDELAHAAKRDPLEYRQALLKNAPRHLAVLAAVKEKSGWGTPLPAGHARGVAVTESFESVVAQVIEVSLEGGRPKVHRVTCAADCGQVVHPDAVTAQMEGAVMMGLSAALGEQVTIKNGRVEQQNYADYPLLRISEAPVVEVHLVPGGTEPGGAGEPGLPPVAPALCNALFALTGTRVRRLPLRLTTFA